MVIFCDGFILVVSGGGGVYQSVVGWGSLFHRFQRFSSMGVPAWGHFVILGWGRVVIGELCPGAPFL